MGLDEAKEAYFQDLRQKHYAEGTLRVRGFYLDQFFSFLSQKDIANVHEITLSILESFQLMLLNMGYATGTLMSKLTNLRQFLHFLFAHDLLFYDLSLHIPQLKAPPTLPENVLTQKEILRILKLPDTSTSKGIRDKALLELLYFTAIRRSELVGLDLYDLSLQESIIRVFGKGKKERIVPLGKVVSFWLEKYLCEVRPHILKDSKDQALFIGLRCGRRIHPETLAYLIRCYGHRGGVQKRVTPHTFRHSCATHLLHNGADMRHIQKLLGHQSIQTTKIYTHLNINDLKAIIKKTHPRG